MTSTEHSPHPLDTREGLIRELVAIEKDGWGSPAAKQLLRYVRSHIVRPQVTAAGLSGPAAEQAEATGWAVAWETLISTPIRAAHSPWGVLWIAVRRAVLGELVSCAHLVSPRNGWRAQGEHQTQGPAGDHSFAPPVSLNRLVDLGWEPRAVDDAVIGLGPRLDSVVEALVEVGWEKLPAQAVVEGVARAAVRNGKASTDAVGWRPLAAELGLPPWRVRRVTVLLLGAPGWPGVIERMVTEGEEILETPCINAALRSTMFASWPSPPMAAQRPTLRLVPDLDPALS